MASEQKLRETFGVLAAAGYAGDVTPERVKIYRAVLNDVEDENLERGVKRVLNEHTGGFLPSAALLRELSGANRTGGVDVEAVCRSIAALGAYNPASGWHGPRVELVREVLGDIVADAYGTVGAERVFAYEGTGREIARRDFGLELTAGLKASGLTALPAAPARKQIAPAVKALVAGLMDQMAAGDAR